jgi:putative hydrolase of the HAD superfamily
MIRAIVFDFGNVICRFDNRIVLQRFAANTGRALSDLERVIYTESDLTQQFEEGAMSSETFYARMCSLVHLSMTQEDFIRAYTQKFTPIPGSFALLRLLKGRYLLGLLSNTSALDFEYGIAPTEIFHDFDAVTLSFMVHALKPEPTIYHNMIGKLGVDPAEIVYIDDIAPYVDAAERLGMTGIHYTLPEQLVYSLECLGIGGIR